MWEIKRGNSWQRVVGEILLLYERIVDLYQNDLHALFSEGNDNDAGFHVHLL